MTHYKRAGCTIVPVSILQCYDLWKWQKFTSAQGVQLSQQVYYDAMICGSDENLQAQDVQLS